MPWTIDWGWTTTSIRSYARPNRMCLDHLEALVHQRGRVDRDLRAHVPGRVRERGVRSTSASSAARVPRKGPPLAVSTTLSRASAGSPRDTASAPSAPSPRAAGLPRIAPGRRARAARRRRGSPCWRARDRRRPERREARVQPGGADDRVQHDVGVGLLDQPHDALRPGQHLAVEARRPRRRSVVGAGDASHAVQGRRRAEPSADPCAASPTIRSSGSAEATSRACTPIDPVAPRITTRFISSKIASSC